VTILEIFLHIRARHSFNTALEALELLDVARDEFLAAVALSLHWPWSSDHHVGHDRGDAFKDDCPGTVLKCDLEASIS
jgi:hypothetical protein